MKGAWDSSGTSFLPHPPPSQSFNELIDDSRSMLVSCGCSNKLPQTWWLKTTAMNSLTILEARSLGASRCALPPEALGKILPGLSQLLRATLDLWPPLSNLCLCLHSPSLCVCPLFFFFNLFCLNLQGLLSLDLKPAQIMWGDLISRSLNIHLQIQSHSQFPGVWCGHPLRVIAWPMTVSDAAEGLRTVPGAQWGPS